MLCRAIIWDDIVLGSNRKGQKTIWRQSRESHYSGVHYQGAILRVTIIWRQLSVVNYWAPIFWEIIIRGTIIQRDNCQGSNILGINCPGINCMSSDYLGSKIRGGGGGFLVPWYTYIDILYVRLLFIQHKLITLSYIEIYNWLQYALFIFKNNSSLLLN